MAGLGVVLFGHYGPAAAGSDAVSTWTTPFGYAAIEPPGGPPAKASISTSPATASLPATASSPGVGTPSGATMSPGTASSPAGITSTNAVMSLHVKFPKSGPETFRYAKATGPVLGTSGPIRRFHVAIESNIDVVALAALVAKIDVTLGDRRSWIAGRQYRLQQVPESSPAQFTVYLVTESTSSQMCAPLYTGGYTSCRQGPHVVLNLDRWMTSVPEYVHAKVALDTYRTYMINHEVGHALGHSHELCPGRGRPAPVMQQQTLGLHGCTANPWPYVHRKAYNGPLGHY